jgi:hydrogenase/urease accessory protein HupE
MNLNRILSTLLVTLFAAEPALAHSVSARFGELYSGLLHPLTTLAHLVPWLAMGLLGGFLEVRRSRWILIAFPLSVSTGVLLASVLPASVWVEGLNLASFVIVGVLVVVGRQLSFAQFATLTALFGVSHGVANGVAGLGGSGLVLYTMGVAIAAYLTITLTTALSHVLLERFGWGHIAVRAAGSWIVAIGLVFGGFTLLAGT